MSRLKYVLIGSGRIAPTHIKAALSQPDRYEIAAVCDIVPGKAEALLAPFGERVKDVRCYTDYREMLRCEQPDVAAVTTESGYHAAIALDCIRAGVNVFIEKPIAMSLADADQIIAAAKECGVRVCCCHQNRFNKAVVKAREALEAGRFGKMLYGTIQVRWFRGEDYYQSGDWRGTWELDGGTLMNQCIHGVDLLRWMMGDEVEEVYAYTDRLNHPYIEAEDLGIALVRFANGSYGIIEGTSNMYGGDVDETLGLFGDKGLVRIGGISANQIESWRFADQGEDEQAVQEECAEYPEGVYGFGHATVYEDMANALREGREPKIDAQAGRRALEMILAIYRSAAEHRPVKLPLASAASIDFTGRFDAARS